MKKLLLVLYVCVMSVVLCSCSNSSNVNSNKTVPPSSESINVKDITSSEIQVIADGAYSSPENALYSYVNAVKGGDLNEISASFAIQDYVDGYDPDSDDAKYIPQPTLDEQTTAAYQQLFTFLTGFKITFDESFNADDFLSMDIESLINPEQYKSLQIVRIDLPEANEESHIKMISTDNIVTQLFGADGWDYRTVLLSLDGKTYYCGFRFVVYNGKYEIIDFTCPTVPLDSKLALIPCTEEEYTQLIGF